ncbi:DNA (cytosine-5-)-methyltransferase [Rhodotorula toruloides]|uniref:DNA (cytosine-5-)-methyltransferase n=1 Tax=Rhodotorula toruloides TaxID=5286 RepID=A0A511K8S2_RHOTO|nr:DNA (cytosine-5-)-methyltransferase [Rhodotorula toruloides]
MAGALPCFTLLTYLERKAFQRQCRQVFHEAAGCSGVEVGSAEYVAKGIEGLAEFYVNEVEARRSGLPGVPFDADFARFEEKHHFLQNFITDLQKDGALLYDRLPPYWPEISKTFAAPDLYTLILPVGPREFNLSNIDVTDEADNSSACFFIPPANVVELSSDSDETDNDAADPYANDLGGFEQDVQDLDNWAQRPVVDHPNPAATPATNIFDVDVDEGLHADTEDGGTEATDLRIGTSKSGGAQKVRKAPKSSFNTQVPVGAPKGKGKEKARQRDLKPINIAEDTPDETCILTLDRQKSKKRKRTGKQRLFRARTAYNPRSAPPPKPPNPFDEDRLADLWPSNKKVKRPLFRLDGFVAVSAAKLMKGQVKAISFLPLLVGKGAKDVVVVGLASPLQGEQSEAEDIPTPQEDTAEVHLWGKYDIVRLDFTVSGLVLHTRLGQYLLGDTPIPPRVLGPRKRRFVEPKSARSSAPTWSLVGKVPFDATTLERMRRLLNVFAYARSRTIRGGYVEEGDEREEDFARRFGDEVRDELERLKEPLREETELDWQRSLPFAWRLSAENLELRPEEVILLFRKLPDIPFIVPDLYRLIAEFFPHAFRTHDLDAVRKCTAKEKKRDARLLERCRRIVQGDHDGDSDDVADPVGDFVMAKVKGRNVEVFTKAIVNGKTFQAGDVVLLRPDDVPQNRADHPLSAEHDVGDSESDAESSSDHGSTTSDGNRGEGRPARGSDDVKLWFGMVVHFRRFPSKQTTSKPSQLKAHILWFATASAVRSLGPYLSPRQLLTLDRCDDRLAVELLAKVVFKFVKPSAASRTSWSIWPERGFFSWAQYSVEDGSFRDVPSTVLAVSKPSDSDSDPRTLFPRCSQVGLQPCPSCETTLEFNDRTREPETGEGSRRPLRAIRIDGGLEIDRVPYHPDDCVYVVPAEDPTDDEDEASDKRRYPAPEHRRPYRLAQIVRIIDNAAEPDEVDEVDVKWITRASDVPERLRPTKNFLSERELCLTDAPTYRLGAIDIAGKFNLTKLHVANGEDATNEIAVLEKSSPHAFYTRFRLERKPGDRGKDKGYEVNGDVCPLVDANGFFYGEYGFVAVKLGDGALQTCETCQMLADRKIADRRKVRQRSSLAPLNHLALYAGGGLLDLGLEEGCPILTTKHAVEKHAPAASCMRSNALHPLEALETTVSNVSEAAFYGLVVENGAAPQVGQVYSIAGGAPCQGFSQANHYKRVDDLRNLEPFVFLSALATLRPIVATFENVAAFLRHALPQRGSRPGSYFQLFIAATISLGYQGRWTLVDAAGFGVPQHRRRLVVQFAASGFPLPDAPQPTHAVAKSVVHINHGLTEDPDQDAEPVYAPHVAVTVAAAIDDLPKFTTSVPTTVYVPRTYGIAWGDRKNPCKYDSPPKTSAQLRLRTLLSPDDQTVTVMREPTHHVCPSVNKVRAERLLALEIIKGDGSGGNHVDMKGKPFYPEPPPWVVRKAAKLHLWWRRLTPDAILSPLRTTSYLDGASHGERIHYNQARGLSLRELLRAQGCPDFYELKFSHDTGDQSFEDALRIIGNGVPVPLAAAIGRTLEDKLIPIVLDWLANGAKGDLWHGFWLKCGGERLRATANDGQSPRKGDAMQLVKSACPTDIVDDEWMDVPGDVRDDDLYAEPAPEPSRPQRSDKSHANFAGKSAAQPSPDRTLQRTPTSQSSAASASSNASGWQFGREDTDETRLTSLEAGPAAQAQQPKRRRVEWRDQEKDASEEPKKTPQVMDIDSGEGNDGDVVIIFDTDSVSSSEEKGPPAVITIEDSSDEDD